MAGMVGPPFSNKPLSNVTPFTYRDGETYLEYLNRIKIWVSDALAELQENIETVSNNNAGGINGVIAQFNAALALINQTLLSMQETDTDLAFDPTSGQILSVGAVIGHVYDNTRYYAYFADQLDDFEYTAEQWDTMQYSARHFDLVLAYSPTTTQGTDTVPATVLPN